MSAIPARSRSPFRSSQRASVPRANGDSSLLRRPDGSCPVPGVGPLALLACLPGEQHDVGLIAFGLALRSRGWRIAYLGTDTPVDSLDSAARALAPSLVVVTATTPERVQPVASELRELAKRHRLALGGSGADAGAAAAPEALLLTGDPVEAAERLTAQLHTAGRP